MKNEHTDQWGKALQEATEPQICGRLAAVTETGEDGFCCLGYGSKIAGLEMTTVVEPEVNDGRAIYAMAGAINLPGVDFLSWLGFDEDEISLAEAANHAEAVSDVEEFSVLVDWPEDMRVQCIYTDDDRPKDHEHFHACRLPIASMCGSYDALNDTHGFSFAQIGDVVRYFGVRL